MSKVLYPKATAVAVRKATEAPLHIVFDNPSVDGGAPIVRHYGSELAAKFAAWYHCRLVGFSTSAVLYTTDELKKAIES